MAQRTAKKNGPRKRRVNRQMVLKALTDRQFRTMLEKSPERALGKRLTAVNKQEIGLVLAAVKGIESQIRGLGDKLLCANGDPCGIA